MGPGGDIRSTAREVFRNFGRYLVEFFRMQRTMDADFLRRGVSFENRGAFEDALALGKGLVVVTAHLGNWELGGAVLSRLGYPMVAIALPHKERPVNDLFNRQREAMGVTVVPVHRASRRCLRALRDRRIVAVVADRDFSANGERMDFLGREVLLPKGAAVFSLRTGAPILPMFFIRERGGRFRVVVGEPVSPSTASSGCEEDRLREVMAAYKGQLEAAIRRHPDQWLMFREFWEPLAPSVEGLS